MDYPNMIYAQVALFNRHKEGTSLWLGEAGSYILDDMENN
jgi:hypothetical protein